MEWGWKLFICVILLVSLGSLYFFEDKYLGKVIWEPDTLQDNCSESYMTGVWDEIFIEGSGGLTIFGNEGVSGGGCERAEYIIRNTQIWILFAGYSSSVSKVYKEGRWLNRVNVSSLMATYLNATRNISEVYGEPSNREDLEAILTDLSLGDSFGEDDLTNWSVSTVVGAQNKFAGYFEISGLSWGEGVESFDFDEVNFSNMKGATVEGGVMKNESSVGFSLVEEFYEELNPPAFIQNISNFTFEKNSSWNYAFDLADHFELGEGITVGFGYVGYNNTGGEWINYSLTGGEVKFKPALNFTGSREFMLSAMNADGTTNSNYFWVNIVPDINYAPVFRGVIADILLTRTVNVTIFLDQFFEELDGTPLTYSVSGAENVSVVFSGNKMYVWLKPTFTNFERFRVIASDGVYQTESNRITVFLDNRGSGGVNLLEGIFNDTSLVNPGNLSAPVTSNNDSEESGGTGLSRGWFWVLLVFGVLAGVLVIGAGVYFIFFAKEAVQSSSENVAVNDYLKKINALSGQKEY